MHLNRSAPVSRRTVLTMAATAFVSTSLAACGGAIAGGPLSDSTAGTTGTSAIRAGTASSAVSAKTTAGPVAASSTVATGATHLTFWTTFDPAATQVFQRYVDSFNVEHPGIVVEHTRVDGTWEKITTAVAGNTAPDLDVSNPNFPARFAGQPGGMIAMDAYIHAPLPVGVPVDEYLPNPWQLYTWKGKQYGVPLQAAIKNFMYNKDIFDLLRLYAGDPAWIAAHLTVGGTDGRQRLATVADIQYSQAAWPSDRDCGLVLGDRGNVTIGFGLREGWHDGMLATLDSFFQPGRSKATGEAWHPSMELVGTDGVLFLGGTSNHVDLYLHRGPWAPPGRLERIVVPAEPITAGPYAEGGAQVPYHTAMVEELVRAIEEGREHRSSGVDGRWALEMILGVYESHRRAGARVVLPLPDRSHPLQRWLDDVGTPQPTRPEKPVKTLQVAS